MTIIRIFLPVIPFLEAVYLKGYINKINDFTIAIYITKYTVNSALLPKKQNDLDDVICGYMGHNCPKKIINRYQNFIYIEHTSTLFIKKLIINKRMLDTKDVIIMIYDYNNVKVSQTVCMSSNDDFSKLSKLIHSEHGLSVTNDYISDLRNPSWIETSMFLQHVYNYWRLFQWFFSTVKIDKKVSIKQGNLILAIVMDLILGYFALQLLPQDKNTMSSDLMGVLEKLIDLLYSLLKWLMGAPVGLKLNKAFNNMLGKYFSYHVQLWWLFLDVSGERLYIILHIYRYIGYLGFTFQIAIISDLICLATFHSYCIYVYAARLFNIQISGLIALLRLFVGRKYNPLRCGIDSCEYTNQELFVGTVAFTILLLLLPTTALYYIVFTGFRLVSLVIQNALAKMIYLVQISPLYVMFLWLTRSPKLKGNILIDVISEEENSPLVLRIKLFNKSMTELVKVFQPPIVIPKQVEWTNLLSNMLIGKQII